MKEMELKNYVASNDADLLIELMINNCVEGNEDSIALKTNKAVDINDFDTVIDE